MDRSVRRFLSSPLFEEGTKRAVIQLGLTSVEKFVAFDCSESDEFVNQVILLAQELVPKLEGRPSVDALETVSESTASLALLWELVINGQDLFLADTASLHGFGLAGWDQGGRSALPESDPALMLSF